MTNPIRCMACMRGNFTAVRILVQVMNTDGINCVPHIEYERQPETWEQEIGFKPEPTNHESDMLCCLNCGTLRMRAPVHGWRFPADKEQP